MNATTNLNDGVLWQRVCVGDPQAFEELVRRHQSAVSAVAYNACGDISLSEDISQETFLTAWRNRLTLRETDRLKAWFCGIARNLARNTRRQLSKLPKTLDGSDEPTTAEPDQLDQAVTREEEGLLWQALNEIDPTYREPLILFYREDQSVAEVAAALDISPDAAKQRLSRGRAQLREHIASMVENALRRTRPSKVFTVAVMSSITAIGTAAKAATAGTTVAMLKSASVDATVTAASKLSTAALAGPLTAGTFGAIFGTVLGIVGGWFGAWLPAQLAPTKTQRDFQLRSGRRVLAVSILFSVALFGLIRVLGPALSGGPLVGLILGWIALLNLYVAFEIWHQFRGIARIRQSIAPETDRNDSTLKRFADRTTSRYEGRVYRSNARLFGWPLVDINVGSHCDGETGESTQRTARGWIAVGDRADGIILAIGGRARGAIAFGGVAFGIVSCGGLALGLFSFGGGAIGALAFGGLGVGGLAVGGAAFGQYALGGLAVAWETACGGGAIARRAAYGGLAIAGEFAVGGSATARHANDAVAKAFFENNSLVAAMEWQVANNAIVTAAIVGLSVLLAAAMTRLMYRRRTAL